VSGFQLSTLIYHFASFFVLPSVPYCTISDNGNDNKDLLSAIYMVFNCNTINFKNYFRTFWNTSF